VKKQRRAFLVLVLAFGLVLAACGGGGGDEDTTGVVKDLFNAIETKNFEKIPDFACADQKQQVRETFDFGAIMTEALGGADADPQTILDMLTFQVSNLEVEEKSKSGDTATLHVKGRIEMTVNPEKFNDVVRELLKAQGMGDVSDELIDQFAGPMLEQFEDFSVDLDDDLRVVKEEGKWLVCDE
jgi:hypothetical protein